MQTNELGQIALKWKRGGGQRLVNGYVFTPKHNIVLAWVDPGDVSSLLQAMHGCCGNSKRPAITYANETDVRRWTYGGR